MNITALKEQYDTNPVDKENISNVYQFARYVKEEWFTEEEVEMLIIELNKPFSFLNWVKSYFLKTRSSILAAELKKLYTEYGIKELVNTLQKPKSSLPIVDRLIKATEQLEKDGYTLKDNN